MGVYSSQAEKPSQNPMLGPWASAKLEIKERRQEQDRKQECKARVQGIQLLRMFSVNEVGGEGLALT